MNKLELIQTLKNNNNLTTYEAKSVVNIFKVFLGRLSLGIQILMTP